MEVKKDLEINIGERSVSSASMVSSDGRDKFIVRHKGIIFLIVSHFFGSLMNVNTKLLESDKESRIHPLHILLFRMIVTYSGTLMYMKMNKTENRYFGMKEVRGLLCIRGMVGFFGVFGMYYSLMYLSMSDAVLISFLAPSITAVLGYFILSERYTMNEFIGNMSAFIGVILVIKPNFIFHNDTLNVEHVISKYGYVIVFLGPLGLSGVYIVIRFIGTRADAILNVTYFSMVTLIISSIGIMIIPGIQWETPRNSKELYYLIMVGISGFIHQITITHGIQNEKASIASLMAYTQLIYAIIWDLSIWNTFPDIISIIGMIILVSGTMYAVSNRHLNVEEVMDSDFVIELDNV